MKLQKSKNYYYVTDDGRLYIKQMVNRTVWGWHYWYDNRFRMCARNPDMSGLKQVTKKEFDSLYFVEKL